jgi:hypothetical protein
MVVKEDHFSHMEDDIATTMNTILQNKIEVRILKPEKKMHGQTAHQRHREVVVYRQIGPLHNGCYHSSNYPDPKG